MSITINGSGDINATGNDIELNSTGTTDVTLALGGGSVGIGTATPTEKLTVVGDMSVDTDTLYVDSANNRVGLGTTSPTVKLDVNQSQALTSITSPANAALRLQNTNGGADNYYTALSFTTSTTSVGTDSVIASFSESAGNSALTFWTDTSNGMSEKMRIDSSGRLGIGAVPSASFTGHSVLQVGSQAILGANGGLSTTGQTYLSHNLYFDTAGNYQVFNTGSANEGTIYAQADGIHKWSNSAATTGTPTVVERARINSSGNLLVGKTTGGSIGVLGTEINANGSCMHARSGGTVLFVGRAASTGNLVDFYYGSSVPTTFVGSISTNGTTTSYVTSSDYRLKENVTELTGAIDRVKQVPVHRFNFIADPDKTVDGFLAHEVADVVPEAITGEKDGMKTEEYEVTPAVLDDDGNVVTEAVMGTREVIDPQGIDQSKLVPLLTQALKDAITKIETLETANADMLARIEALEAV